MIKTGMDLLGDDVLVVKKTTKPQTEPQSNPQRDYKIKEVNKIYQGDCIEVLKTFPDETFDMIFADPPYFLSNDGITCIGGKKVSVNKGDWDKSKGILANHEFNKMWLKECQRVLTKNGTIWVSGTNHVIFSIGFAMQELDLKILNDIAWEKPNPPPNLSCRYFTHSTETIIWAAKNNKSKHCFNYDLMREINEGKQMKTVWKILPPKLSEKEFGKHPTQKPLELISRCITASTNEGDLILDPFFGSGTTGVSALSLKRKFIGIELSTEYIELAKNRLKIYG
jgi:site-specific DNA-methyltransferase (adenine-specific)